MNGDGCSTQCQKEPFFNCVGESRDAVRLKGPQEKKTKSEISNDMSHYLFFFHSHFKLPAGPVRKYTQKDLLFLTIAAGFSNI